MACGEYGEGKMSSPRQIYSYLENYFNKKDIVKKRNFKALVTAGPTREYIDPIRYISNESSGKQGYEIALALAKLGIKTVLITGPSNLVHQKNISVKKITTADEMLSGVNKSLPVDIAVCSAAVSDFKPLKKNKNKLKKKKRDLNTIQFENNKYIVEIIGKNNKNRPRLVVGFSAETENLNKNSQLKMIKKNCDLIVANDVSNKDIGFNSDYNKVSLIDGKGNIKVIKKNKKSFVANKIVEVILDKLLVDDRNFN